MNQEKPLLCPCYSGKNYKSCCEPYHKGLLLPENALLVMRSRYSAYALGLSEYIISTTHPDNSGFQKNRKRWLREILEYSTKTLFEGLEILDFIDGKEKAWVTFVAHLRRENRDSSFKEKSFFICLNGKWLYLSGQVTTCLEDSL